MSTTSSGELLDELSDFVSELLVQYDYPGFESRGFHVGLPEKFHSAGSRLFGDALNHPSVYVQIVALRWFQEKPETIKPFVKEITTMLKHQDEWVRAEALGTLERFAAPTSGNALSCAELLGDSDVMVRRAVGKALCKILPRVNDKVAKELADVRQKNLDDVLNLLKNALTDADVQVRQKAEKALRKSGSLI